MFFLAITVLTLASFQGNSTYTISGILRDEEGKASPGVYVDCFPVEDPKAMEAAWGRSDSKGNFVLHLQKPGKYIVIYDDETYRHVAQKIAFFRDPNNPPPQVVLTETAPTAQVDIRMSRNGTLSGQALDAQTQLPIDHVYFAMCHADQRTCWAIRAKSDDGRFSIPAPFVPFTLSASATWFEEWFGLSGSDRGIPISVPGGTNTSVTLLMRRRPEASSRAINEAEKKAGINLPAPEQLSPEDNQVFDAFPRTTKLEWKPVEGAMSYGIEVDYCEYRKNTAKCLNPQALNGAFISSPPEKVPRTSYEFNFIGAQPGRWRVWAVDRTGREGFKSSWRTFVYQK